MSVRRRVGLIVLAFVLGANLVGCSWVLGVSDEPVIVDAAEADDAAAADEDAGPDGSDDAALE